MQDIHTHLYWESYDADRDEVIQRAHSVGVEQMFVIGCTVEESKRCIDLAEKYPEIFASVGIHPNELNQELKGQTFGSLKEKLRELAQKKKVVAIGECGLDYFSHGSLEAISDEQKAVQKEGFLVQIALAEELQLPLIVHCRSSIGSSDAYEDMFEILHHIHSVPCVLHCYMGDTEVTEKFLTLPNVYFSFTANITYPVKKSLSGTKDDLTETVKCIPLQRIFIETDCPFLAPQSKRGERNEPSFVNEVLSRVAKLQNREISVVEQATEENSKKVFPKSLL